MFWIVILSKLMIGLGYIFEVLARLLEMPTPH